MIDISLNKALVAVEVPVSNVCNGCILKEMGITACRVGACLPGIRKDSKNVIFKLVDYYPDEGWDLR